MKGTTHTLRYSRYLPRTPQCPESPLLTREKIGDLGLAEVFGGSKPISAQVLRPTSLVIVPQYLIPLKSENMGIAESWQTTHLHPRKPPPS